MSEALGFGTSEGGGRESTRRLRPSLVPLTAMSHHASYRSIKPASFENETPND